MEPLGIEIHPWNWYGPEDSTTLLIGTFPPTKRNWSFDFFYPNKRNLFWNIIANITHHTYLHYEGVAAVAERKQLLDQLKVTITDMGKIIERTANNSLDENLIVHEYMDIFQILKERPSINQLIFTSSTGKSSAAKWFEQYAALNGHLLKLKTTPKPAVNYFQYKDRLLKLIVLYSPSARAANRIAFTDLVNLYKDAIMTYP